MALAAGCAAAGIAIGPQAPADASSSRGSATSGVTTTPVLSVRRIPGWVSQTAAAQRLAASLPALLAQPVLGGAARASCLIVSQGGHTLYDDHPVLGLLPASNMKLLTATAVLDRLGAGHRMVTSVKAVRPRAGVVRGDLYLVGGGDPLLANSAAALGLGYGETLYTSLDRLAAQVRAAGITRVTGSVVGDDSRYDGLRAVPSWSSVYEGEGDVAPLSALEVNDDDTSPAAGRGAAQGSDPAAGAAATFTTALAGAGITVAGSPTTGTAPSGLPLLTSLASPPLDNEVDAMLSASDNTAAELFTKELGYQTAGSGTTAAGVRAIRADLAADGLPVSQLVGLDGSGLDRADRVTCNLIEAALERLGPNSVVGRGLPIAGQTGTLKDRMRGTPAAGRVRAKTGTLSDVVALSGFVLPAAGPHTPGSVLGDPIVFSLIFNQVPNQAVAEAVADRVGVALATYPKLPPLADIEPRP